MKKHLITKGLDALNILSDTAVIHGFLKLFPAADPRHGRARQHRDMPKQSRHFHLFKTYMASIEKFPLSFSQSNDLLTPICYIFSIVTYFKEIYF